MNMKEVGKFGGVKEPGSVHRLAGQLGGQSNIKKFAIDILRMPYLLGYGSAALLSTQ
jgi:hypothetical protein